MAEDFELQVMKPTRCMGSLIQTSSIALT